MPVFALPKSNHPVVPLLVQEIVLHSQWWEFARKEIIPERFRAD
jgi:hypothetical protein